MSERRDDGDKPYHHGDLRHALVEAGTRLLHRRGVAGLSLRAVAKEAGVSHGAPYRHFADKSRLLAAIAAAGFERLGAAVQTAVQDHPGDPRAQLAAAGLAYVCLAVQHPEQAHLMFGGVLAQEAVRAELRASGGAPFQSLAQIIAEGQRAGVFRTGEPLDLTITAWSLVHGLSMLVAAGQLGPVLPAGAEVEHLARRVIQVALRGLLADPG